MPLIIPKELPAYDELSRENVFVMHRERAQSQNIRPLRILILNLMPTKIVTETQLARLLANSPLQVQITLLKTATHDTTHTSPEHMQAFYKTFDEIKEERFDGMIITGAPIEDLDYPDVDYWDELCKIMDYTKTNVYSTIHLCWGALAGLYYHFGIPKVHLPQKMFGVFEHRVTRPSNPLVRGFDEVFYAPHSRWAGLDRAAIDACHDLRILAESDVAGRCCFPPSPAVRSLSSAIPSMTNIPWTPNTSGMWPPARRSTFPAITTPTMTPAATRCSAGAPTGICCTPTGSTTMSIRTPPTT